jgi:hypothetical protein
VGLTGIRKGHQELAIGVVRGGLIERDEMEVAHLSAAAPEMTSATLSSRSSRKLATTRKFISAQKRVGSGKKPTRRVFPVRMWRLHPRHPHKPER